MQKKKTSKAENLIRVCEIQNEITEILLDKFQAINNIQNNNIHSGQADHRSGLC